MKATIQSDELTINLVALFESMPDLERAKFAEFAVFNEKLLQAVAETAATGCAFEGDWYIGKLAEKLREKLLPLMPAVVQEHCRALMEERDRLKSRADKLQEALTTLSINWPEKVDKPESYFAYHHGDPRNWNRAQVRSHLAKEIPGWEEIKAEYEAKGFAEVAR